MLKHLMSGASLIALALRDAENDTGAAEAKEKLRAEIAKGNVSADNLPDDPEPNPDEDDGDGGEDDGETDPPEPDPDADAETEEQKKEREAAEKVAAKEKRKNDRMQRRIDEATARAKTAEEELAKFKNANPDVKLTEEEVEAKAEALAATKLAAKQTADTQEKFDKACEKLAKEATKLDKDFNDKVEDMADQFGPIPSFMIGVLEDFENGAEVLALMANDDEIAEKVYSLKTSPAKMTRELVAISNKLIEAKKKPKKEISKVPDPIEPVTGSRHVSTTITEADTKNMDVYVAKRRAQMEVAKKARGW